MGCKPPSAPPLCCTVYVNVCTSYLSTAATLLMMKIITAVCWILRAYTRFSLFLSSLVNRNSAIFLSNMGQQQQHPITFYDYDFSAYSNSIFSRKNERKEKKRNEMNGTTTHPLLAHFIRYFHHYRQWVSICFSFPCRIDLLFPSCAWYFFFRCFFIILGKRQRKKRCRLYIDGGAVQ